MAIEIVDVPIKHGGSFHSYVKLPEGIFQQNHYWAPLQQLAKDGCAVRSRLRLSSYLDSRKVKGDGNVTERTCKRHPMPPWTRCLSKTIGKTTNIYWWCIIFFPSTQYFRPILGQLWIPKKWVIDPKKFLTEILWRKSTAPWGSQKKGASLPPHPLHRPEASWWMQSFRQAKKLIRLDLVHHL